MVLSEFAIYRKGKPAKKAESGNVLPILTPEYLRGKGDAENGLVNENSVLVEDNDVVLLWDGSNAGEFFKAKRGILASTMVKFIFSKQQMDESFFFHQLKHHEDFLKQQTNGSGIPHVDKEFLLKIKFTKTDKAEQTRIAEILSKADEAIAHTEALIAKYQRIKTGLMQDLLTRGIDENGNIRSEETHEFKDSPLGRIPVEWEWGNLGRIYQIKSGSTPHRKNKKFFENGKYNWVKTLDLNEGTIYETEEKITDLALENTSCKIMPSDSILIAMYGGWEQIGRTAILGKPSATNQAISVLQNPNRPINSYFIQFFLQYFRFRWKLFAVSTRKDPNITKSDIENFHVSFPSFKKEQDCIVDRIQSVNFEIKVLTQNLAKLHALKRGLMQDLLSGAREVAKIE